MADKWEQVAAAWVKKTKNGDMMLSIKFSKDMSFKEGENFALFENRFYEKGGNKPRFTREEPPSGSPTTDDEDDIL